MATTHLVTGGTGYFGSALVERLRARGVRVRVLDLNDAHDRPDDVELFQGDIRDPALVERACQGVDTVFHNVAQVPLARDRALFDSVNIGGARVLAEAAARAGVRRIVATSSSAVFGVPESNPVTERTLPRPMEEYGRAKLTGEYVLLDHPGVEVSIIRPRTILGHGRLGIFSVLFDWIASGDDVYVLGAGDNRYQFVHADDLAEACVRAGEVDVPGTWNIGAADFGTMRETIEGLIAHAGSASRVRSLPMAPTVAAMRVGSGLGLLPFAPYHWLMYGRSMWFDITPARRDLGWEPRHSTAEMFAESYETFLAERSRPAEGSHHRRPLRSRGLDGVRLLSRARRRLPGGPPRG